MASGRTQPPASPRRTPRRCRRGCPLTMLSGHGAACARGNGAYQQDGECSGCQSATHGPIVRRLPDIGHYLQPRPGNRCSTGGGPGPPAIDHEPRRVTRRFVGLSRGCCQGSPSAPRKKPLTPPARPPRRPRPRTRLLTPDEFTRLPTKPAAPQASGPTSRPAASAHQRPADPYPQPPPARPAAR